MRILALGPVELARTDGTPVPVGGAKPKALLLALLQQRRRVLSLDQIIDLIWDESPPQSATASVHTYVSALRRGITAAGGASTVLMTRAPGYVLDVPESGSDSPKHIDSWPDTSFPSTRSRACGVSCSSTTLGPNAQ